jgi:acetolactate synthase-1/2/3 large subunit
MRTGGRILVDNLLIQGADLAFCVPGESYLAVLDALYDVRDRFRLIVCRQEGGAAYMGEAYGKLTGRPGIVLVTRGPGACNAAIGIHTAQQDSSPLIVFVGQVGGDFRDREAFQEIDYTRMYGSIAKWVAQIDRADRIPEYVARAFRVALDGRRGPVVLALPEDMLHSRADTADALPVVIDEIAPSAAQMAAVKRRLDGASRPLVIAGGSGWNAAACADLASFAQAQALPVASAFRNQDVFDNAHPHYVGEVGIGPNPALAARVRDADLLLVIGERLGEMVSAGYSLPDRQRAPSTLVHVLPGGADLGRVYAPALGIVASMPAFAHALAELEPASASVAISRRALVAKAHADYLAWQAPRAGVGAVDLWQVATTLREQLPPDAIVVNGAGNFATWMHRLYRYRPWRTQLAPYNGSMGYGVPAAIAAKLVQPERVVISWNGDGCFQMNGQELATAAQYGLRIVFIVVDNRLYGTIRMHQERHYPGRVIGTELANPDFAALARAYGLEAETIRDSASFAPALERALAAPAATLLHLVVDAQAITMAMTLDQIRAQARAAAATSPA